MSHPTPQEDQAAYDRAHEKYKRTPDEQTKFINDNLRHLDIGELRELVEAMQAERSGDKGALKRLTQQKQQELEELRTQYAAQLEGNP